MRRCLPAATKLIFQEGSCYRVFTFTGCKPGINRSPGNWLLVRCNGFRVSEFQSFRVSEFQGFRVSVFQTSNRKTGPFISAEAINLLIVIGKKTNSLPSPEISKIPVPPHHHQPGA